MLINIKISRNAAFFSGLDKPRMVFFPVINVKMPRIVGILTLNEQEKLYAQLS